MLASLREPEPSPSGRGEPWWPLPHGVFTHSYPESLTTQTGGGMVAAPGTASTTRCGSEFERFSPHSSPVGG